MRILPSTRKPIGELTLADLDACAIWEYAIGEESRPGQDETTVRPRLELTRATGEGEIVRARFIAAAGRIFIGTVVAGQKRDPMTAQPSIVMPDGRNVTFWWGAGQPTEQTIAASYAILATTSDQLFPLTYRADVPSLGPAIFGEFDGFGWLESDLRTVRTSK